MRYNELVDYLQKLTNIEVKPYDMVKALGGNISKYTYRRDNNGNFSKNEIETLITYLSQNEFIPNLNKNSDDEISLDYYPDVFGSCSSGVFELSQEKETILLPKKVLFSRLSPIKRYSVINARGNSMQPFIYDSDKLVIEHFDCGQQIIDNQIYIFCFENQIFIKRLFKNVNQLIIKSDNPEFDVIKLCGEEVGKVEIIGQIVGLMREIR